MLERSRSNRTLPITRSRRRTWRTAQIAHLWRSRQQWIAPAAGSVRARGLAAGGSAGEGVEQPLQGAAGVGEAACPHDLWPRLFGFGGPVARGVGGPAAPGGR